ncbi:MAG: 16S rRNA (guanine(966)-N(2))-methyltransferase RsmD [Armatimonadota bacterium]
MRITGGQFRGRNLHAPKGAATRPTSGMVRESLFNILAAHVPESRFLDLFAGCGSVGLEARSRGAAQVILVENARPALACLQKNVAMLAAGEDVTILPIPAARALEGFAKRGAQFDIIFLDPPFADTQAYLTVLEAIAAGNLPAPDALLIAQHDVRLMLPEEVDGLIRYRVHPIGDNALSFYTRQ